MGSITEEKVWVEEIYLLEETDLVKGGEDGMSNRQPKELANRTAWLKEAIKGYVDVTLVSASTALEKEDVIQKMIFIDGASSYLDCTLPALTIEDLGLRASIVVGNITKQAGVVGSAIQIGSAIRTVIYLGPTDRLELIWIGDKWIALDFNANILSVGDIDYGYSVKVNTTIANGTLKSRADFPRLWQWVETLGASVITDATWLNTPNMKGFFSSGNGLTDFRVPDLRSMFIRGLDLGAGITIGRNNENAGGYEADEFKKHAHVYNRPRTDTYGNQYEPNRMATGGGRGLYTGEPVGTSESGGTETRPKNIGLLPLIKV